MLSNINLI